MRIGGALALLAILGCAAACGRSGFFRQYEYEEELYLSLDGSATVYVNSSIPALNALRGSSFDTKPSAPIDRRAVRDFFNTPVARVVRLPSLSRRNGRRFVHVRLDVDDIQQLSTAAPFAWSTYKLTREGDQVTYRQHVRSAAGKIVADAGWTGGEIVSFRAHMPSTVLYHNAGVNGLRRGNILVWEQPLSARLSGEPLEFEARMESQSILSRTLLLFGGTASLVVLCFVLLVWWIVRRPRHV
jgi:hypothetical protein